jgi:hypothetical protein
MVERFLRGTIKGFHYFRDVRSAAIPVTAQSEKVSEEVAAKTYDLYRPALTRDGTVSTDSQKKALEPFVKHLGIKTVPNLGKVFDYSITQKISAELNSKGWTPNP